MSQCIDYRAIEVVKFDYVTIAIDLANIKAGEFLVVSFEEWDRDGEMLKVPKPFKKLLKLYVKLLLDEADMKYALHFGYNTAVVWRIY
jgi:hypothetical protein